MAVSSFALRIPISKRDEASGIVYGWAALSTDDDGLPVIDSDNEYIPIDELERAAHDLFRRAPGAGKGAAMHETMHVADLIASLPLDRAKRDAFGFGEGCEGWLVGLAITDPETKRRVFSGEWSELSIRGTAIGVDVEKLAATKATPRRFRKLTQLRLSDIEAVSLVDRGASGNSKTRPRIVLAKREQDMATKKQVEKARSAVNVIADLLEGGKLGDLPEEDKALLLGLIGGAPAPAPEAAPADMPVDMELSEAAKRELAKAAASVSELAKRNAELEDRVAKMQADLELSGLVEFVKSDLSHLPSPGLSTVELAKVVGSLRRNLGADELKAVETILKAASDTIRKSGSLRAVGHSGDAPEGTPEAQLRAAAVAIRKASGDKLSISQALVEAGKSNPALWAEYKAARNT